MPSPSLRSRLRASATHFSIVTVVLTGIFLLTYGLWYPKGLFVSARGIELFLIIAIVDLTVGPLLTFIVYVPGKKGLFFDMSVIVLLQTSALAYGLHVLYESRPAYLVFVMDRFELVRANAIPDELLAKARATPYGELPLDGPRIVGARIPDDPRERDQVTFAAIGGIDLHHFPQHYVPYDRVRDEVRAHAAPLAKLRELNPGAARDIDRLVSRSGVPEAALRFLPVRAGRSDLAAIIDLKSGDLVEVVALRPWSLI